MGFRKTKRHSKRARMHGTRKHRKMSRRMKRKVNRKTRHLRAGTPRRRTLFSRVFSRKPSKSRGHSPSRERSPSRKRFHMTSEHKRWLRESIHDLESKRNNNSHNRDWVADRYKRQ